MMPPFYRDNHNTIYCLDFCKNELPAESVQCVVTSPPYWGLRKYSGEQELIWLPLDKGKDCEHQWGEETIKHDALRHRPGEHCIVGSEKNPAIRPGNKTISGFCSLCGAWKGSYGLEPTPEMYVQHTIEILREIRRVLRKDGVVFWNIGDSYSATRWSNTPSTSFNPPAADIVLQKQTNLPPKNLCLIPSRVQIAAQEDGWWVRSIIIWSKPNAMPESVNGWRWERHRIKVKRSERTDNPTETEGMGYEPRGKPHLDERYLAEWQDCPGCPKCSPNDGLVLSKGSWRPTDSYEQILMLTKTDTYYCDADAVREAYTEPMNRWGGDTLKRDTSKTAEYKEMQNIGYSSAFRVGRPMRPDPSGRNLRNVWPFPTVPYPGAHFAVFPEKLPELCIKAATPEVGCCSKCGAPWARIVEKEPSQFNIRVRDAKAGRATPEEGYKATEEEIARYPGNHPDPGSSRTVGWRPSCKCNAARVPSLVLDPFMGAGTTLWVAKTLNRKAVGYEISEEYCQLTVERCRQQVLV